MGASVSHCKADEAAGEEPPAEEIPSKVVKEDAEPADEGGEEAGGEEGEGEEEEEEEEAPKLEISQVRTVPYDPRFPTTNQARNCYTRYNEFYKCAGIKGEEDEECKFYQRAYRSLCPGEWVEKWNEQRENGNWAGKY